MKLATTTRSAPSASLSAGLSVAAIRSSISITRSVLHAPGITARKNIAVFDAKPQNFLIWEDALFPVDVIPVQPAGPLLKKILAAL
jgi:hypothetical protein